MVSTNDSKDKPGTRTHRETEYKISPAHPVADAWPWMTGEELQDLADDIGEHEQRLPILRLPDGRLLDGRTRELACLVAGVPPWYETLEVPESAIPALIESLNGHRRHMT